MVCGKGGGGEEVESGVETMAHRPRSLGNQFPPKNPKGPSELWYSKMFITKRTYRVSGHSGSVGRGGRGRKRACVTCKNSTRHRPPFLQEKRV
jgi:hypothetical protein